MPRKSIQPLANASECAPNRFSHGVPAADGGAITRLRRNADLSNAGSLTVNVAGSATPAARYTSFSGSTAPCVTIGPMLASTPCNSRCALPKAYANNTEARPASALPRHQLLISANKAGCDGQR